MIADYRPTLAGKLRRETSRLAHRRPAPWAIPGPMVSFTFDDVPLTAAVAGAAALESRGVRGVFYVCGGLAGGPGPMGDMADPEQIRALAARGHEIACHTYSHPDFGVLAPEAAEEELDRNAATVRAWGLPHPTTFAYPYGEVSDGTKARVSKRFSLARSVRKGVVRRGSDLAQAPAVGLTGPRADEIAARWLDRARRANGWIIFYTHDVREEPSAWGTTPQALVRIVDAALARGFEIVTAAEGARRLGAAA